MDADNGQDPDKATQVDVYCQASIRIHKCSDLDVDPCNELDDNFQEVADDNAANQISTYHDVLTQSSLP